MRSAALLIALLVGRGAHGADIPALIRAHDWPAADALAAAAPDPLAAPLVTWLRLLARDAASAPEIDRFLAAHPDWPLQPVLAKRYDEALVATRDDPAVAAACARRRPTRAPAMLRCADALSRTGADPTAYVRSAWLTGISESSAETAFMRRYAPIITQDDQRARFDRLALDLRDRAKPDGPLARQVIRLGPAARQAAEIRLALRRLDPGVATIYAALPDPAKTDPGLVFDYLRYLRQTGHETDAAALWSSLGEQAEAAVPPERRSLFWDERNLVIRALLAQHADQQAYDVAALATAASAKGDATFLAGWIALRRLNRPDLAATQFRALADLGVSALTQSRAHYWLARTLAATPTQAADEYRQAAAYPTTYYGQLAALAAGETMAALGARLRAATDPTWTEPRALNLAASPFGRAAALLVVWGDKLHAKAFLAQLDADDADPATSALLARYATELGLPDAAVAAARRAGQHGIMLPVLGWPEPVASPATIDPAVALGLIRQESSFDAAAGSPVGAQGLMQLMPATAADMFRKLHETPAPLTDPAVNMRLGTAYVVTLLDRFAALPPALAGYNAGPGRTAQWLAATGDPATGSVDPIDWIELIPYGETRDYVQRVIENVVIYHARMRRADPHPVLRWAPQGS